MICLNMGYQHGVSQDIGVSQNGASPPPPFSLNMHVFGSFFFRHMVFAKSVWKVEKPPGLNFYQENTGDLKFFRENHPPGNKSDGKVLG